MPIEFRRVHRALLSVSDKTGLIDFARGLAALGVELISTGGTHKELVEAGFEVLDVEDLTGFPELMDGRLKTLHPVVHGGLLAIREDPEHEAAMLAHGISPIDLLVVNLYPFQATIEAEADFDQCVEEYRRRRPGDDPRRLEELQRRRRHRRRRGLRAAARRTRGQ